MQSVTGIGPAKRRSGWVEIQLDGVSCVILPEEEVSRRGLAVGIEIDQADLAALQDAAAQAEASRIALRYLAVRPRSRREVESRLGREHLQSEAIERTLRRLVDLGYLNDRTFAAAFARDRIRLRPCGARRMRADLFSKGVASQDAEAGIQDAMAEEDVTEDDLLERVAGARALRLARLDPVVARRRLFGFLERRGFASSSIRAWIESHREQGPNEGGRAT